jgi:hypothetical protein
MNLVPLFEIQSQLDERIEREHPRQPGEDRFGKKVFASHGNKSNKRTSIRTR